MEPKVLYTSDRGDEYEVARMETSHLINVIGHHVNQRKTLATLDFVLYPNIHERFIALGKVIDILAEELTQREANLDEYIHIYDGEGYDD